MILKPKGSAHAWMTDEVPGGLQADLVPEADVKRLTALLSCLNTEAEVVVTRESRVDPKAVMGTGLFSLEKAARAAGWLKVLTLCYTPSLALRSPAIHSGVFVRLAGEFSQFGQSANCLGFWGLCCLLLMSLLGVHADASGG